MEGKNKMRQKEKDIFEFLEKSIEKYKIGYILLLNLLFIVLAYSRNTPYNETNDDTGMAAIASGAYGVENTEYLVFQNIIWGKFLKLFYTFSAGINWYSVWQLLLTVISVVALGYLIMDKIGGVRSIIIYIIILKLYYQEFYLIYQFTRVSMLCCLAGYLLLFYSFTNDKSKRVAVAGGLLVLIGFMIRSGGFKEVTIFAFPVGVCGILLNKKFYPIREKKKVWLEGVLTFVIIGGLLFGANQYNKSYTAQNEEWGNYQEYNRMRAVLQDYGWPDYWPDYTEYQEEYEKIGISRNDYEMYKEGNLSDADVLDMETLQQLYELKIAVMEENMPGILDYVRYLLSEVIVSQTFFWNLMILVIYFVMYRRSSYDFLMFGNIAVYSFTYVYMYHNNRLVDRVTLPTDFVFLVISLFCLDRVNQKKPETYRQMKSALIWIVLFFLLIPGTSRHYMDLSKNRKNAVELYEALEDKSKVFVAGHDVFRWNYYFFSAYKNIPKDFYTNQINMGGWLARTPVLEEIKQKNDIENSFAALLQKDDIYYYTSNSEKMVNRYLEEHYSDGNVGYSVCKVTPVCKFVRYSENFSRKQVYEEGEAVCDGIEKSTALDGYIDITVEFLVPEDSKLLGEKSQFYLEIENLESGECYTYYFCDDLEDWILQVENEITFTIPEGQVFRSMDDLQDKCDVRGMIVQEDDIYVLSGE